MPFDGHHPKWELRAWSIICGLWTVLAMLAADTELSVSWGVWLALLVFGLQYFMTSGRRMFISPAFLGLVFGTGYPLSFAALVNRSDWMPSEGWGTVGRFTFTDDAMLRPFQIMVAGVFGLAAGTLLAERIWSKRRSLRVIRKMTDPTVTALLAWGLACVGVILICSVLGIGRVGLENATALPIRISGILIFARACFLPALGAWLVQQAIEPPEQRQLVPTLLVLASVGVVASLGALSRGLGASYTVPAMFFAISRQSTLRRPLRRLGIVAALMIALLATVGFIATIQRTTLYSGEGWMSASEMMAQTGSSTGLVREVFNSFGNLIGDRLSGMDVFLALISGPGTVQDPLIPVQLFFGDTDLYNTICQEAVGFVPAGTGGLAFGIAFPLLGVLGLGGTFLIPFIGTAVLVVLVCSVEGFFGRYGAEGIGTVLACILALSGWSSPAWFNFSRIAVVSAVLLVLARQKHQMLLRSAYADTADNSRTEPRGVWG